MSAEVQVSTPTDGVGLLVMDHPPKNFASYELLQQIEDGLKALKSEGTRVVVLASDIPGYFMAHAWLTDVIRAYTEPDKITGDPLLWRRVTQELERGSMVSIACNNGQAWGGGAEVSWACNLRTAGRSAHYAQIESVLGVIPGGGGTARLSRLAGQSAAMEIFLSGEPMSANRLHQLGIVNRVFPDEELRERTLEWAELIASRPHRALQANKRGILQAWDLGIEDALRIEGYIFNSTMRNDTLERMKKYQAEYDAGANSWDVYGLDRSNYVEE
jgi:enoyl-CoA hydratase/carnithine racemase